MRISDLADWFALREHLKEPWAFLKLRKHPVAGPHCDVPLRDGRTMRLRSVPMDRRVFHRIFARDEYRLDSFRPGSLDTVIDVGAHIGAFAMRAARLARRVLCYEPVPANHVLLAHNVAQCPNVTAHCAAVGGERGTLTLHLSSNPAAHSVIPVGTGNSISVPCVTLADILDRYRVERCDYLKLNCEGSEYAAVYALPPALWERIRYVAVKYHPMAAPASSGEELSHFLRDRGFRTELEPSRKNCAKGTLFAEH